MTPRARILPVFVPHLGCPYQCVFCNQNRITGEEKPASAQSVHRLIEQAASQGQTSCELAFYGGSFTAIPAEQQEELLAAAKTHLDRGELSSIRLSTRPDAIDAQVIERLHRFGVGTVELGAQSMAEDVLRRSGRGHTAAQVAEASILLKNAGFHLILQMMTGLPGDSRENALYTARQLAALAPDGVRIYPTVIVRDTPLYTLWQRGLYREHTVEEAVDWCAEIVPVFDSSGIQILRLGLNPTEELSGGAAAGGAYHPALGEMVRSRILRKQEEQLLTAANPPAGSRVILGAPGSKISQAIGQHRCNLQWLKERYALRELRICPAETGTDAVVLLNIE